MRKKRKFTRSKILCIIILLIILGMMWQGIMAYHDEQTYTSIGDFVDLGTYQAHYYSKGNGDVTFVFVTGAGTPCAYTDFYMLQNKLSDVGQTISFDHAGSGWSGDTKVVRSIENLVDELSVLIDTVAPNSPVVLICHSLGSLETIAYAQRYPERVKGIIFLDSGSPEFYSTDSELLAKLVNRGSAFLRTVGLNRLLGGVGFFLPIYGENIRNSKLQDDAKKIDKVMFYQFAGNIYSLDTIRLINENGRKVLKGPLLGQTPILVLSSDSGDVWKDVQIQLASWSENSKQITIDHAKHYLYWSNYEDVEYYINEFIQENFK